MKRMPTLSIQEYGSQWWWVFESSNGTVICSCPHRSSLNIIMNAWEKMGVGIAYHVKVEIRTPTLDKAHVLRVLEKYGYLVTKVKGLGKR